MTAFVEKFALEVAATIAVGAVTGFLFGLTTGEPKRRPRRSSACPNCGTAASRDGAGLRRAA
jgi:hypothetical protein